MYEIHGSNIKTTSRQEWRRRRPSTRCIGRGLSSHLIALNMSINKVEIKIRRPAAHKSWTLHVKQSKYSAEFRFSNDARWERHSSTLYCSQRQQQNYNCVLQAGEFVEVLKDNAKRINEKMSTNQQINNKRLKPFLWFRTLLHLNIMFASMPNSSHASHSNQTNRVSCW